MHKTLNFENFNSDNCNSTNFKLYYYMLFFFIVVLLLRPTCHFLFFIINSNSLLRQSQLKFEQEFKLSCIVYKACFLLKKVEV